MPADAPSGIDRIVLATPIGDIDHLANSIPADLPVTQAEIDLLQQWCGDILGDLDLT